MSELLNLIGLTMGIVLYTVLLVMVVGAGRTGVQRRIDPLLLATSLLGLVWNLCALPAYELPRIGVGGTLPVLTAIGLSTLGFLPAVVVHSVLRGEHQRVTGAPTRAMLAAAYTASTLAAALHLVQAARGEVGPSPFGMQLLTYTYVALVVPLAAVTRSQAGARRTLWAAALAIFAVSALHLSQLHRGDSSWPVELLGHHASLPLAIAILYQDFPFAFADLFLKRALSLLTAVAVAFAGIAIFSAQSRPFAELVWVDPRQVGVLVTPWVASALLFPWVRRGAGWFVDRIVLSRPNYRTLRADVIRRIQTQTDVPALLADVCRSLAPALNAADVTWRDWHRGIEESAVPVTVSSQRPASSSRPRTRRDSHRRRRSERPATALRTTWRRSRRLPSPSPAGSMRSGSPGGQYSARCASRRSRSWHRSRAAGVAGADQPALPLQRPHHDRLPDSKRAPPRALETLMRLTALLRGLRSEGEFTSLGRSST